MVVKFTEIQSKFERKKINDLYYKSVPPHEKSFVLFFWWKRKRANVSFVNIYDEDKWVGFLFFSFNADLVYVWFFAIDDTIFFEDYASAMFSEIKRLYPNHRIALSIEAENENADNAEKSIKGKLFYKQNGFHETGYFVKRKEDSFEIMLSGETFHIDELYSINKEIGWLIGRLIVRSLKKEIQRK